MTPEQEEFMTYMQSIADLEPSKARIARDRERAKELRAAKTGGLTNTGRFMVAPHPLEHFAVAMSRQAGQQREEQAGRQEEEMMRQRREYLAELRKRLDRLQQPQATQQQPSTFPSYGGEPIEDPYGVAQNASF